MTPRQRDAEKLATDRQATRIVGGVMSVGGALLLVPELLMTIDGGFSFRVTSCSLLIAVPLLVAGVRRLTRPDEYDGDARGDLD